MSSKKSFPLSRVYQLLEPGPVVLLSTHLKGKDNVMTMSWHTMLEFEPPLIGCVVSGRDFSFDLLRKSKECVLNIPTRNLAQKVVKCGNSSGRDFDKFSRFGLTKSEGQFVKAPLIDECYANLECRVVDTKMVTKYNFFVLEAVKAWVDPKMKSPQTIHHQGYGRFFSSGPTFKIASKMK